MSNGLYSGVSGLALGTGLYRNVSGLWGGASGLINNFAGVPAPTLAMDFLAGTYDIAGAAYTFSQLVDFTRTSAGTYINSSGYVATTTASTNLLLYTEALDNATWTKVTTTATANSTTAPDGTPTADTLTATGTNSTTRQTFTATAVPYTFSVYLKRKTGTGNVDITVDGTTYVTQAITSSWVRYSTTLTPAAGSKFAGIRIATSGDEVYVWGAQLELGSSATTYTKNFGGLYPARFDYDPTTLAAKGFLVEPQSSNLCLYSNTLSNASWTKFQSTIVPSTETAPDGTLSAWKMVEDTSTNYHGIYQSAATVAGTTYTTTFYAKAAERSWCFTTEANSVTATAFFNLANGTVGPVSGTGSPSATITPAGNGWYRCSMTFTPTGTISNVQVRSSPASGVQFYTGDGTSGINLFGVQLEALAYPTSYIPTTNATVTRTADNATIQTSMFSLWYNSAASTIAVEFDAGATSAVTPAPYHISDGTSNNRVLATVNSAGTGVSTVITAATAAQFSATNAVTYTQGAIYTTGAAYTTNSAVSATNGVTSAEDNVVVTPTVTSMRLGSSVFNANYLSGHMRGLMYYNTRLTNSQLQTLTA